MNDMDNVFFRTLSYFICITFVLALFSFVKNFLDGESDIFGSASDTEVLQPLPEFEGNGVDNLFFWTDEETGVQYIIYNEERYNAGFGGITPRLNTDGSLYVVNADNEVTPPTVVAE